MKNKGFMGIILVAVVAVLAIAIEGGTIYVFQKNNLLYLYFT